MLGYMNRDSLARTLESKRVSFWSRSRSQLWTKGETSGNYLTLSSVAVDCDGDTLLITAVPQGPTCHLGRTSCFGDRPTGSTAEFPFYLEDLIRRRKAEMPPNSYTTSLFKQGVYQIARKLGEEAIETMMSMGESKDRTVEESGDLLYHLLVFLAERDVRLADVLRELEERHGTAEAND
jgi:phosphoribosyl-ATP pyrophosphohydrolase/phosphoribosyl-AMP cyclohydrolase